MEIVIFVDQRTNAEFLEKIDELRYSFGILPVFFQKPLFQILAHMIYHSALQEGNISFHLIHTFHLFQMTCIHNA